MIVHDRIRWHLQRLEKPRASKEERLIRWRLVIRAAQDAYEKEVQTLEALNSLKADPSMEVEIVG